ncbi:glutamate receptor 2.8-like [Dorcoceras hygrometricum]|uniref:Glutamate receptor n=1 Tax=Dorcoceras hygrometricum TaxID=472368 RepID=A0A2Z7C441_9LAMI|nr:glutamate receptor 2.8-like [Dorcoceras hygrometricum]
MSCLSRALEDFYSLHGDYKTKLVLNVRDSNDMVIDAAAAAVELLRKGVDAIIGPQKSEQANFVMDLGDRAHVPIISFSATSPSLIPRTRYFIRTAQSDANQVGAIASICKAFQFSQAVVIYEDTEFGNGILPNMANALQDVNTRISYRSVMPRTASDDAIYGELYKMMTMQTRVFVVHTSQSLGGRIFLKAKELGMMSSGYAWIVTNGITDLFDLMDLDVIEAMQGVLGVKPLLPLESQERKSFALRWIRSFMLDNHHVRPAEVSVFGCWAYDTMWALAMAAETLENTGKKVLKSVAHVDPQGPFTIPVSETGPLLLDAILATRFTGISGEFHLENGQLTQTRYQIVNIVGTAQREVGIWVPPYHGVHRELNPNVTGPYHITKEKFKSIIWPGDSTTAPRGWEVPVSGKKLRIGVPVKPGFNEFLQVELNHATNAITVSGYYKEIFDSVMAALPYAVPHEFVPYPFFNPDGSRIGNYSDLVYQVSLQEKYDAALGDITITANRSIYADFTLPYAEGGITSVVPIKYEDENGMSTFTQPLTKELWLTTALFYTSTALAVWIIARRIADPPGQHAGLIAYFPFFPGEGFQSNLLCLVLVTWALVASLLNSTYTASLSSRLTLQRLQPSIMDVTKLIRNGKNVGCQEGSFLVDYLKWLGFDESKIKTFMSADAVDEALTLGSEYGGISAFYDVLPHIRYFLVEYCQKYMMMGPIHRTDGFAFVFPKGSPIVADVSRAIVQLTEDGKIQEIDQLLSADPQCASPDSFSSATRVTLRSFVVLFAITGCVTLACLIISLFLHLRTNTEFIQRMSELKANLCSRSFPQIMSDFKALLRQRLGSFFGYLKQIKHLFRPNATGDSDH